MADKIVLRGRKVVGGRAEGEALVARATLSFWGEVDAVKGVIIAAGHPLKGQSVQNKVLVMESTKGSSGGPMMMTLAKKEGNAPAAMVNLNVDCLAALGCVVNDIPMMTDLGHDPFELIETGDYVVVDADRGIMEITKQSKPSLCSKKDTA